MKLWVCHLSLAALLPDKMFPTTLPHNRALLLSIAPTLSCRSCQEVSGFAPGKCSRNASKKSFRDKKKKKKHARILVESQVRIKEKGKESCYATSRGDRETAVFLIPAVDLSSSHHPKLSKQRTVCYFRVFRQLVQMGLWKTPPSTSEFTRNTHWHLHPQHQAVHKLC